MPAISGVSGTWGLGNTLTVACAGEGSKARSKLMVWADAQEGAVAPHSTLSYLTAFSDTGGTTKIEDTGQRWGAHVFGDTFTAATINWSFTQIIHVTPTPTYGQKFYSSHWVKFTGTAAGRNVKPWRAYSQGTISARPNFYVCASPNWPSAQLGYVEDLNAITGITRLNCGSVDILDGQWHQLELELQFNATLGSTDGVARVWIDNVQKAASTTFQFNSSARPDFLDLFIWQTTLTASTNPNGRFYHQDLVLEDSWNRVVIGNASTYAACTEKNVQPYTSWGGAGSISVSCHPGNINQASAYMYLIGTDGIVSAGFALSGLTGTAAPTISTVTPASGPTAGSTALTINGTNFVTGETVRVKGALASSVVHIGSTQITANTPAGAAGYGDVQVTNPDSQSATKINAFQYIAPPSILNVTPSTSSTPGGGTLTIVGNDFQPGATVNVGTQVCDSVNVVDSSTITATIPSASAGTVNVQVINPDGQSVTATNALTYTDPIIFTIDVVSPASGSTSGGAAVGLTGKGFQPGSAVTFGGLPASGILVLSDSFITCVAPAHSAGVVSVTVTRPTGEVATKTNAFSYATQSVIGSTAITSAEPKIYTPNAINSETAFSISTAPTSVGAMFDGDRGRQWESAGVNSDVLPVTIEVSFRKNGSDVYATLDSVILLNHNLKAFQAEYWDDTAWQIFASGNNLSAADFVQTVARVVTKKVRITSFTTQIPNQEKSIGELILCALTLDIGANPMNYEVQGREKVATLQLGDGSIHEVRTKISATRTQKYQCRVKFQHVPLATLNALIVLKESGEKFLWQPESSSRPDQVFLVNWSGPLSYRYATNYKGAGYEVDMSLREL